MKGPKIYLDHAATTPLRAEVLDAMLPFLAGRYGNPSSLHGLGREARKAVETSRALIADILKTSKPADIIFTSGGTESDNLAIKGVAFGLAQAGKHIITSQVEHSAILEPCSWLESKGWQLTYLPVDREGFVRPEDLKKAIQPDTILVSIMHANNEVGTIQPIVELSQIAREHNILFHTDAVQTLGKLQLDLSQLPVDLLSGSAHKLYGPKGSGFLYANEKARRSMTPWLHGGSQQEGLRPGTENVATIIGLAKALELVVTEQKSTVSHLRFLQEKLLDGIKNRLPGCKLNGPENLNDRLPGNVNLSFPPVEGEALVLRLDMAGLCVSSGSACHSSELKGSHVLQAMGCTDVESESALRFSIGKDNTPEEIDTALEVLQDILSKTGFTKKDPVLTSTASSMI